MNAQATSFSADDLWIADSGASHHMTNTLSNMTNIAPYTSGDTIKIGNGEGLSISHIGTASLSGLHLNTIYHVPQLATNLLSVYQLCKDNNCWVIFDASNVYVQDKATKTLLFQGKSHKGLYPIPQSISPSIAIPKQPSSVISKQAFLGQQVHSTLWHQRFGHVSNDILHHMLKQSQLSVHPDATTLTDITEAEEPRFFKEANSEPEWQQAMVEEIEALTVQGTWIFVPRPSGKNVVGCKWIYKVKRNADGSIARHKARLVAQGFSQEPGIDFEETFSPVVLHTTVRIILSLAASNKWPLRQLDVKNAFLHGELQEEVYMRQPLGFEDVEHPDFVCRLQKSLYGLKQAPRAWNAKFTGYLPALGFCSSPSLIQLVIDDLSTVLDMKDMGTLTYFLGLQITYGSNGDLFVHQTKYCKDLLKRAGMEACKPSVTPCKPHSSVLRNEGSLLTDPTQFRSIVGALQYLTFTRPDIAFAVNSVCQFMQAPTDVHVGLVKRILRYLHGTLEYGLTFTTGSTSLTGYCDADWAGDPNSHRSTTGYVVFLGNYPVSWSSRKQSSVSLEVPLKQNTVH
ncbi:PREDICTED: Retrovirus-related Pol poly from [Prunus dulcis]|uniref:PREDICTED: Retrovirus-related Pol poly from n=1 Tax=Prunus dulcis TaxID=3755 RepID=A0A5E4FW64_PRUDU|nr:PREDICTED: Retrovirus-related Pol poly from [Prunus dulcis]